MYQLKRVVPIFDIQLPNCMYPLKNITRVEPVDTPKDVSTVSDTSFLRNLRHQIEIILKNSHDMADIESRQQKVFEKLEGLKDKLKRLKSQFNLPEDKIAEAKISKKGETPALTEEAINDIVINVHPDYIPYGFSCLRNIWQDVLNLKVKVYAHSSITKISKEAEDFQRKISHPNPNNSLPVINVTLIWKNCEHTEMISSPTMYIPIFGEVNILRYLARVGPKEFRYEDLPTCNEIDSALDICYQILRCKTGKERVQLFRALDKRLGNQKYFGGEKLSVADIAFCSTIRRLPTSVEKDLSANLKVLKESCENLSYRYSDYII